MAGYSRQKSAEIVSGAIARASDIGAEFDQVQAAFNSSAGHTHSGSSGEGAPITVIGPAQDFITSSSLIRPKTDDTYDLGSSTFEFKDGYFDGTLYTDAINLDGTAITATAAEINYTDGVTSNIQTQLNTKANSSVTISAGDGLTGGGALSSNITVAVGTPSSLTSSSTNSTTADSHTHAIDSTIARSAVTITAGNGLTGGGDLTTNRTLNVGAGTGIAVSSDAVALTGQALEMHSLAVNGLVVRRNTEIIARTIFGGDGITVSEGAGQGGDPSIAVNSTVARTSTSVLAGEGLVGGGDLSSTRTIDVGAGDGIVVSASAVGVDGTVVRTSGTQTIGGEKTFTSNAQFDANLRVGTLSTGSTGADGFWVQKDPAVTYIFSQCRLLEPATTPIINHYRGSNRVFSVLADGDVVNADNSYGAISDSRLKQDIEPAGPQLEELREIDIVKYRFKTNPEGPLQIGVTAQQLQEVKPGLVEEQEDGILSVKYSILVPILVKAVQELADKVDALELRVSELEGVN